MNAAAGEFLIDDDDDDAAVVTYCHFFVLTYRNHLSLNPIWAN